MAWAWKWHISFLLTFYSHSATPNCQVAGKCPASYQEEEMDVVTAFWSLPCKILVDSCGCLLFSSPHLCLGFARPTVPFTCDPDVTGRSYSSSAESFWPRVEHFVVEVLLHCLLFWFWVSGRNCLVNATVRKAVVSNGKEHTGAGLVKPSKNWQYCRHNPTRLPYSRKTSLNSLHLLCLSPSTTAYRLTHFSPCFSFPLYKMGKHNTHLTGCCSED